MSTRSLIGILNADGTYQARYCYWDGYPEHQVPQLAEALYRHHDGDVETLLEGLLREDWRLIAPAEASAELESSEQPPSGLEHVSARSGLGYCYSDYIPYPIYGTLACCVAPGCRWLYLFTAELLRVFMHDRDRHCWRPHRNYLLADLKDLDALGGRLPPSRHQWAAQGDTTQRCAICEMTVVAAPQEQGYTWLVRPGWSVRVDGSPVSAGSSPTLERLPGCRDAQRLTTPTGGRSLPAASGPPPRS